MNAHIEEFLNYFCSTKDPLEYAVLIEGNWGSGKTHFIRKFQKNTESHDFINVSLYGVTNFAEVENLIFSQIVEKNIAGKGIKNAWIKKAKKFGSLLTSVDIPELKKYLNFKKARRLALNYLLSKNKYILIFDDLERAEMAVGEIFGHLNSFVEFGGQKIVFLASERGMEEEKYFEIKEKIIGKTFVVHPNLEEALEVFLSVLDNKDLQIFFKKNKSIITKVFEQSGYKNIRLTKQALLDFGLFYSILDNKLQKNEELCGKMLELFLIFSIELKKGVIKAHEIPKLVDYKVLRLDRDGAISRFQTNQREGVPRDYELCEIYKKYPVLSQLSTCLNIEEWEQIIGYSILNKDRINQYLLNYFSDKNTPNWRKLWYFWRQTDEEFTQNLNTVDKEFKAKKYTKIGEVIHVFMMLLSYAQQGLYSSSDEEIIKLAKEHIDVLPISELANDDNLGLGTGYAGLGFSRQGVSEAAIKEFWEYFKNKKIEAKTEAASVLLQESLNEITENTDSFIASIGLSKNQSLMKQPVLNTINTKDFWDRLKSLPAEKQREFMIGGMKSRYGYLSAFPQLVEELAWLKQLSKIIEKEAQERAGKLSSSHYKSFLRDAITPSIVLLEAKVEEK